MVNGNYSEVDIPRMTEMVDAFLEAGGRPVGFTLKESK